MGQNTGIEWTDATWNPWHGCHKVSPGCKNCYMFRDKKRYGQDPNIVARSKTKFSDPLSWPKEPTLCFACSWSDWLIEEADPWREEAYDIIRRTPWITYQILTKRIERAVGRVPDPPLPNIWLGVSVEDQAAAVARIPLLLQTPAAVRFVSYEPALGPVDFTRIDLGERYRERPIINALTGETYIAYSLQDPQSGPRLDWIIVGGESGPGARPPESHWFQSVRDQCVAAQVPFFLKQWGEWLPALQCGPLLANGRLAINSGIDAGVDPGEPKRVGKKAAGALLDGREWKQFPEPLFKAQGALDKRTASPKPSSALEANHQKGDS